MMEKNIMGMETFILNIFIDFLQKAQYPIE